MKLEYDIEFKAKVGAWALDEDCGIVGASTKFDVPSDLSLPQTTSGRMNDADRQGEVWI